MRKKILDFMVKIAVEKRKNIYIAAALITLILGSCIYFLKMDMRWTALLPQNMPVVKEFTKIGNNFLQPANMIIAVSGENSTELEKITDEITETINQNMIAENGMTPDEIKEKNLFVKYVYGALPEKWLTENALKLQKVKDTERMVRIFDDSSILEYLKSMNDDFEREYTDSENVKNQERKIVMALNGLEYMLDQIDSASQGAVLSDQTVERTVRDQTIGSPYSYSLDRKMVLVMVASSLPPDDADGMILMDKSLEKLMTPIQKKYPEYKIERTGMSAIARDEMDSVGPYTIGITFGAMLLIFILLAWNFRSAVTPLLNLVPIVLGIIWSMGLIAITIGTLNMITMMMMVVLLGLGIDFTIHLSSRFYEEISNGTSLEEALRLTISGTGKGVITGALTTAAAFYALMIADTPAIFQFGFCAGTGVVLTLIASLIILPALLASRYSLNKRKGKNVKVVKEISFLGRLAVITNKHYVSVISVSILLFALGIVGGYLLEWEWNFMNLEPAGLRSVELQDEIVDRFKFSVTTSMYTVDSIEKSRELRKEFKSKRVVADVDDVSQWVSREDYSDSVKYLKKLKNVHTLSKTDFNSEYNRRTFADEVDRLWANMVEMQALSFTGGQDRIVEKINRIAGTRETRDDAKLRILADRLADGDVKWETLQSFSDRFSESLYKKVGIMTSDLTPVELSDLPEKIKAQYKSKNEDRFIMHIFPKKNLYTRPDLENFQAAVSEIAPGVTGNPQLILKMNLETLREGKSAILAAIIVILFLLIIDFKRPLVSLVTFLPVLGSFCLTMGVMWIFRQKLNYLNMIALPVILGIGIDDGVHFMHRYIEEGHDNLSKAVKSVGRAMLMTSLTTMIGFGSLMVYLMRGMASLGFVLFFGVGFCFIVTMTFLPALMHLFDRVIFRKK